MTVLPVAERELRAASRRPGSYWIRMLAAVVAIIAAAWIAYAQRGSSTNQLGAVLFSTLSGLAFLVALFAGVGFTADAISSERREGTLGLLFLTDLKPWDVIAGKLAANSLGAVYGLVAVIPVLAIPLLLGGVTGKEYVRALITVLNTLLWSLSAGLFVSTFHSEARTAANQAFGLVFATAAFFPAAGGLLGAWLSNRGVAEDAVKMIAGPLICLSPGAAFAGSFEAAYGSTPELFFASNGAVAVATCVLLFLAGRRLPGCWQNSSASRPVSRLAGLVDSDANQGIATAPLRTRLLEISPFVWLVCRRWWRRNTPWLFIIATLAAYVVMGLWVGAEWWIPPSYLGLSIFLHFIFKVWVAGEAPRQIFDDRRTGAMELLLTLPIQDGEFIKGHLRSMRALFLKPLLFVLGLDLLLFAISQDKLTTWSNEESGEWALTWLAREWFLVLDIAAIAIVGLRHGAATRRLKAQAYPFFLIVIVPWLLIAGLATIIYAPRSSSSDDRFLTNLLIWWAIGSAVSVTAAFAHWRSLNNDFRSAASIRPGEKHAPSPQA